MRTTRALFRRERSKLISAPAINASGDEHAHLIAADKRFRAALSRALRTGGESLEGMRGTVRLKQRTSL